MAREISAVTVKCKTLGAGSGGREAGRRIGGRVDVAEDFGADAEEGAGFRRAGWRRFQKRYWATNHQYRRLVLFSVVAGGVTSTRMLLMTGTVRFFVADLARQRTGGNAVDNGCDRSGWRR